MAGRSRALFVPRNATKRHDLAFFASHLRGRVHLFFLNTTRSPAYINETKAPTAFCRKSAHVPEIPRSKTPTGGVHHHHIMTKIRNITSIIYLAESPRHPYIIYGSPSSPRCSMRPRLRAARTQTQRTHPARAPWCDQPSRPRKVCSAAVCAEVSGVVETNACWHKVGRCALLPPHSGA